MGGERGHAASDHLASIYYNPAGLALGHGTRGQLEGLFAYRTADYERDPAAIDDTTNGTPDASGVAANSGKASLANTLISPFLALATDAGVEGFGIGVAVYAPFGGQAKWDQNAAFEGNTTYPGAVDGPQRWAVIEAEQRSLYYTLAAGYRITDQIAVGAGLNVVQSSVSLVRARNLDGSDDLVGGGAPKEGRSLIEADGITFGASLGVIFKPTPCSRVGVSYQSQPGFGEMSLDGTLTNKFGTGAVDELDIEVRQSLPDVFRIGGEWRAFEKASLHAAVDYQRWSKYKNTCIMTKGTTGKCEVDPDGSTIDGSTTQILVNVLRNWKDTVTARVGGRYFVSEVLEVNGGLSYDSSAVPDETMEPSLFDLNKVIGQLGVSYTTGKIDLTLTVGRVQYLSKTTDPRTVDPVSPSRNPDMAGTYEASVSYGILGVGMRL